MNLAQHLLLCALRLYRWFVSPALTLLFGAACRFEPTCSVYAMEAVRRHGAGRGGWLAVKRLARCQPWGGGGCDPIPVLGFEFGVSSSASGGVAAAAAGTHPATRTPAAALALH